MGWLTNEVPVRGTTTRPAKRGLEGLLLRIIPAELIDNDLRSRSRALLLLRFAIVGVVFTTVFFPYFVFVLKVPYTGWTSGLYCLSLVATPLILRATRSIAVASHWTLVCALAVLAFQAVMLGGVASLSFPWLAVLPVAGMLLCGTPGGMVWTVIATASIGAIGAAGSFGWLPDAQVRSIAAQGATTVTIASLSIALGCLGWLFETRANTLLRHLERQRQTYHDRSLRDVLTGLANRALLAEYIIQSWERCRRTGPRGALFFIDLNQFKAINDQHGHFAGDQVLREVALRLKDVLRRSDIAGRIGGDEFALVVEGIENRSNVAALADKVASALEVPIELDGGPVQVGASIGIALYPDHRCEAADTPATAEAEADNTSIREKIGHETVRRLLQRADEAMYTAKRQGRRYWIHGDRTSGEHQLLELA